MLAASRPARSLVLPMKPVFMHGPGSCAGVLGDGGGPGGRESIRLGECPFCTVRADWPNLTGNTASAALAVSSSPIVSGAVTAYGLPLAA
jgi:hypothetical protein